MNAPERYREVVARLAGAVVELRERDAERAAELRRVLRRTEQELRGSADTLMLARGMYELRWEAALQVMWSAEEPGKPRPRPDHRADPARHAELEREADEALDALRASGDRRFFRLRNRDA
ncbi:hypothetical protein [Pseudonocardia sp. HH130630-07]|uniref:hypothetical protein n=1 Tax=Pseudonocardia sp. HH130630-07 TaxID=1690815 RepID=UPI000814B856|nr:hypothetical protein [Pseudonocardia sp. HH130630-07]ANY07638.1 hypothetical protein AFB00_16555 [Pseudonocardia sp. HH130630-07]